MHAQKLKFESLGIHRGLPATEVYNLYQDKKGYVWAFTEYGIVKNNGIEFIPACKNIPLIESAVYVVTENNKGEMYFGNSTASIYKIRNDSAFLVPGLEKAKKAIQSDNDIMFDMVIDDSSNIYFSSLRNAFKFNIKNGVIYNLTDYYSRSFNGECYKQIGNHYFLIPLKQDNLNGNIRVINKEDKVLINYSYKMQAGERCFMRKNRNGYYFLTYNGMIFINNKGEIKKQFIKERTINIETSPDGRIWVGVAAGGLYEFDSELNLVNHYLDGVTVSDILFDNQSGMWISTLENGVYYCKNIYDIYYANIPELTDNISVLKKINGELFIGTGIGNLFVKNKNGLQKIDLKIYPSHINDIISYGDQYLVGTKNSIYTLDKNFNFIKELNTSIVKGGANLNCYGFVNDLSDTITFISASALTKYYNGQVITNYFSGNILRSITRRKPNELMIGTYRGLFLYDSAFYSPDYLQKLQNVRITKLKNDINHNVWICTRGYGLYKLTPQNILVKYENIPSEVINDISFSAEGFALLSTNKGLFINYSNELNTKSAWILILDNETISAEEYNDAIYIATKQGLISFNSKYILKNDNTRFYLESIVVNGKTIPADSLNLTYKQNDIYFNFDFLAYQFPDQKLRYQLAGNSASKGFVKGTQIHLQNLSPGHYKLTVQPLINLSSQSVFTIPFFIKPAFWQTTTFYVIMTISILLFILGLNIFIFYRLRKKKERKAMINTLLAEYRLTALKAQINPHFISNSLAAIQQLIINNEIDRANQYLAKFSLLIRYVLKYSDKSAVRLKHEIDIIDLNVELEQLRFGNSFVFEKNIHPDIVSADLYIPPLITQPFIENAIWHGLLPLKNSRTPKILLNANIVSDKLVLSIIDNGVGRKNIQNNFVEASATERESRGVWIIKNRMETLNSLYSSSDASINTIDLFDEKKESIGTRVDIIFPISILESLYDDKNKERYN